MNNNFIIFMLFLVSSSIFFNQLIIKNDFNKRISHLESVTFESSRCLHTIDKEEEFE